MYKIQTDKKFLSRYAIAMTDNQTCIKKIQQYLLINKGKAAGIAANQLFMKNRVFGIWYDNKILVFENPRIISEEGNQKSIEGCLSIKNGRKQYAIDRPEYITIESDNEKTITFKDYYATVIKHEMDHLEGKLISDKGELWGK